MAVPCIFFKWSGLLAINTILHNLVSFIHKTSRKSPLKKAIMKSAFYALALSSTLRYTFQLKEAVQFFPLFQTISKVNIHIRVKRACVILPLPTQFLSNFIIRFIYKYPHFPFNPE